MTVDLKDVRESVVGLRRVADAFDAKGMPAGATANRVLADQTEQLVMEIERQRILLRVGVELDNHHNAAFCPYCLSSAVSS